MKRIILILVLFSVLSILCPPTANEILLYQGVASQDIGVAFIGFTLALLMRTKDKK